MYILPRLHETIIKLHTTLANNSSSNTDSFILQLG
uniref:Uncharacterized protein n=1 Tax=Arundo donax TaxID=35708 RepID=A0A0A8YAW1_ARUDO